jgi:serine/threonine-protein kinase RsbW
MDTRRLSVPANDEGIRATLDAFEDLAAAHGLSKAVTWPVELTLDEVLANVVRHGLAGRGDSARVEVELSLDPAVEPPLCEVLVVDDGPEFDPLAQSDADTSLPLEDRPIGGLGITLVRRLMDAAEYERREGRNCLRLRRKLVAIEA